MRRNIAVAIGVVLFVVGIAIAHFALRPARSFGDSNAGKGAGGVQPGVNASLGGRTPFPSDNPWNVDISSWPLEPDGDKYITSIGPDAPLHPDFGANYNGAPYGIPYVVVSHDQPRMPVRFESQEAAEESDQCYYPIPLDAPIEPGDRHVIVIDRDAWVLFELYGARMAGDRWQAGSGAVFDLNSNAVRPEGWTSADAAGLPIFPGLIRYDEVMEQKEIRHALRFTCKKTQRAFIYPARHRASKNKDASVPPMGLRVRLKASFDISGFPECDRVILKALKKYGMFLSDNGGNWFVSGAPDARWSDEDLQALKKVKGSDFEVVLIGNVIAKK
jgi:hypothetical protein